MLKPLKYILLLTVLTANLFCMPITAETGVSQEAEGLVNALSIMPEIADKQAGITRGEFAYAAAQLIALDTEGSGAKQQFNDTDGSAYEPCISALAAMGVIEGCYGNVYEPDRNITEYEAVKIIMRALGYGYIAEVNGATPAAYLQSASGAGLTKGISVSQTNQLSYDKCIKLLFNALDVSVNEMISVGDDVSFKNSNDNTALSMYRKVYKSTGVIYAVGGTSLKINKSVSQNKVLIGNSEYLNGYGKVKSLIGEKVKYYYKNNESESTAELIFASPASDTEILTVSADDAVKYENRTLTYSDENDKKRTAPIEYACDVMKNGMPLENVSDGLFDIKNGSITLIDNDGNGKYEIVIVKSYINYVFSSSDEKNGVITVKPKHNAGWFKMDTLKSGFTLNILNENGEELDSISNLSENTVISVAADKTETSSGGREVVSGDAAHIEILSSGLAVAGIYTGKDDDGVYIDGEKYEISNSNYLSEKNIPLGTSVTLLLDCNKKAVSWSETGDSEGLVYGYLVTGKFINEINSRMEVKILDVNGDIAVYGVSDKANLNNEKIESLTALETSLYRSARYASPDKTDIAQLIKYSLNSSGEINKIETLLCAEGLPQEADKDHLHISLSKAKLSRKGPNNFWNMNNKLTGCVTNNSVLFFSVPSGNYSDDDEYSKININDTTWPLYEAYAKTADCYDFDDAILPKVMVVYGEAADETLESYCMVDKVESVLDDNENVVKVIKVFSGVNGSKTYETEYPDRFAALQKGDIITVKGKNEKAKNYDMIFSLESAKKSAKHYKESGMDTVTFDGDRCYGFGETYAISGSGVKLQCGETAAGTTDNSRQKQWGFLWHDSKDYFECGAIMYNAESDGKPQIMKASKNDIVCAIENPNNPTLVYSVQHTGGSQLLAFYKGLEKQ